MHLSFRLCCDFFFFKVGKEAMKAGVGFFNKQASDVYKGLQENDKKRQATDTSSLVLDKKKSAAKIFKVVHKKGILFFF